MLHGILGNISDDCTPKDIEIALGLMMEIGPGWHDSGEFDRLWLERGASCAIYGKPPKHVVRGVPAEVPSEYKHLVKPLEAP